MAKPSAPTDLIVPVDAESLSFVRALIERGEAVDAQPGTPPPSSATHLIVGHTVEGYPILQRIRLR
jgi:hypothetical protein